MLNNAYQPAAQHPMMVIRWKPEHPYFTGYQQLLMNRWVAISTEDVRKAISTHAVILWNPETKKSKKV